MTDLTAVIESFAVRFIEEAEATGNGHVIYRAHQIADELRSNNILTTTEEKLPLIGRDRFLVEKLAKALHTEARRIGDYTPLHEIPRGNWFEVRIGDGEHVARVTIELDRLEQPEGRS